MGLLDNVLGFFGFGSGSDEEESGLMQVERILPGIEGISFHYLSDSDVVRHRLVGEIVGAYDRYDATKGARR